LTAATARRPLTLRDVEQMLQYVHGSDDRETWLAIGMALKAEFGPDAFEAWDRWSSDAPNYCAKACKASWRGFKAKSGGYTIGTVVKFAQDGGFKFEPGAKPSGEQLAELARRRAERAERARREAAERQRNAATAMERALATWKASTQVGESAYLQRKLIDGPESIRYSVDGGIVIPMLRYDLPREQALKGVQIIGADGSKKFTWGMEKPGTACRLGLPVVGEPVFVCEGWATGMSIRMALRRRYPVFVAFDAYNLPIVTEYVHGVLPGSPLVICADDDWKTARKVNGQEVPWNTGRIQAQIAMDSVMDAGAKLVVRTAPLFSPTTRRSDKDTDFNDLHRLEGLGAVEAAMEIAFECIQEIRRHG
jgi:putative DNA primase/helicase